jgi:hypothetical protein
VSDPLRDIERAEKSRGTGSSTAKEEAKVEYWRREVDLSLKREKRFRENAKRTVEIYECAKRDENSFNILYANTETLLPACYNQLPRPFVKRRFDDADPVGKAASETMERTLESLQDTGDARYEDFDTLMQQSVLSALVPGRGVTWFKYDADISVIEPEREEEVNDEDGDVTGLGGSATDDDVVGDTKPGDANEKVEYETVCGEDLNYDDILYGYSRTWANMPWVARAHDMTKEDAADNFGEEVAEKLTFVRDSASRRDPQVKADEGTDGENNKGGEPTCLVYEIWIKSTRKLVFFAPSYSDGLVDERDDPLGLSGFFPCPQPLQFLLKKSGMIPTPIYMAYEQQAKELNRVSMRINRLITALKVRGFYDGTIQGLKTLLNSEDNTLIAAKNVPAMQDIKGLDNAIWFMPIEKLINVLQQLYVQREQVKNTIYEITGISDIMRGDTQASETFGAQKLKSQWGTARLQRMQRYVQRYVRECLRIMGEISAKHFSVETFEKMTDLDFATPEEVQQAQQVQQQVQQWMAMNPPPAAPPAAPGQPPAPPQQPQIPPNIQQAMQQAEATLKKMPWSEVMKLLQNDLLRDFRVDIETNSTIEANSAEDKQNMTEALQAIANMFDSFLPMVEKGALTMPVVKEMTLTVCRRFSFGREMEDAINAMPDQLPPPSPPPGTPTPAEQAALQAEAQQRTQAAQQKMQLDQLAFAGAQKKAGYDQARMAREEQLANQKHSNAMQELQAKMALVGTKGMVATVEAKADMAQAAQDTETARVIADEKQKQARAATAAKRKPNASV